MNDDATRAEALRNVVALRRALDNDFGDEIEFHFKWGPANPEADLSFY